MTCADGMLDWQQRLHVPLNEEKLCQPLFAKAVLTACDVLRPSLKSDASASACALVIGPPHSGKSMLTRLAIKKLQDEIRASGHEIVVIQLSGLLHSTPARAWQQLSKQLVEWNANCLLESALPSKMSALDMDADGNGNSQDRNTDDIANRYRDAVQPILARIKETGCGLLLVLDEVHRFANADPLAQTVLYSLLNLLQDRSLRAACIAQTPYIDVTDLLEKRVLSRLSHRKIVVPLVDSSQLIMDFLNEALLSHSIEPRLERSPVPTPLKRRSGRARSVSRTRGVGRRPSRGRESSVAINPQDEKRFAVIKQVLKDDRLRLAIDRHLSRTRIVAPILRAIDSALTLTLGANDLNDDFQSITEEAVSIACDSLMVHDGTNDALSSLTQVQLALLVALRRVEAARFAGTRRDGTDAPERASRIVFTDVYAEYQKLGRMDDGRLAELDVSQCVVELPVAQRAWELLIESGIVMRTGTGPRDSRPVYCAVAAVQIESAVDKNTASSAALRNWARRNVTAC